MDHFSLDHDLIILSAVSKIDGVADVSDSYFWKVVVSCVLKKIEEPNFTLDHHLAKARTLYLLGKYNLNKTITSNQSKSIDLSKVDLSWQKKLYAEVYHQDLEETTQYSWQRRKYEILLSLLLTLTKKFKIPKPGAFNASAFYKVIEKDINESLANQGQEEDQELVNCPMYCRTNCAVRHHPLLVAILNCKSKKDKKVMEASLSHLEQVIENYESSGKWLRDDPIPDNTDGYRYPMIHWACSLGFIECIKWLIAYGVSRTVVASNFGNETVLQKTLLCLQETAHNECFEKFEAIVEMMEPALFVTDTSMNTVLHTCSEYLANDIPKYKYFQHCLLTIVYYLRSKQMDSELRHLIEMQNSEGNTCLHILCRSDKCYMQVRTILAETAGQNPIVTIMRNNKEQRPIDVACKYRANNIFKYLLKMNDPEEYSDGEDVVIIQDDDDRAASTSSAATAISSCINPRHTSPENNDLRQKIKAKVQQSVKEYTSLKSQAQPSTSAATVEGSIDEASQYQTLVNIVYDKEGHVIGEKLELVPVVNEMNKSQGKKTVTATQTKKTVQDPEQDEAEDNVELQNIAADNQEEDATKSNVVLIDDKTKDSVTLPTSTDQKSANNAVIDSEHTLPFLQPLVIYDKKGNVVGEKIQKRKLSDMDEQFPTSKKKFQVFLDQVKFCGENSKGWLPLTPSYCTSIERQSQWKQLEQYLESSSEKLKDDIIKNLVDNHDSLQQSLQSITDVEKEVNSRLETVQEEQIHMATEVNALVYHQQSLHTQEQEMQKVISHLETEAKFAETQQKKLKDRLNHCTAALNVLDKMLHF